MKRFRLNQINRLAVTTLISILIAFSVCFWSPLLSAKNDPFLAVFNQAWETVSDNFYDPDFNGVDWVAVRKKYQPIAANASSTSEIAFVINRMLGELHSSHTHFYTQAEPAYYQLLGIFQFNSSLQEQLKKLRPDGNIKYTGIGAFTQEKEGKTFVNAILNGSPAAKAGLKVGDEILLIDGKSYEPIKSFVDKADKEVTLLIQPDRDPSSKKSIAIAPIEFDPTRMFLEAQQASIEKIERDHQKIGYIHIWTMAGDRYQEELEEELFYGRLRDTDGLIIDLRDGWGGTVGNYLHIFTGLSPKVTSIERNGTKFNLSYQWKKPVVMLINEGSRSAKEILAFAFQKYGIGAAIGSQTAGAVLAGRPFLMQDGSLLYVAIADVLVDGERLEGKGVTPKISVPFVKEYVQGNDPQKERAIDAVLQAIAQQN